MAELPLVGTEFAGYRLRSVISRGGMSVVFQAENPRLGSMVALKVIDPELAANDVFRARFLEESRIAASLNHPHVIPIYDVGPYDGLLFIAMRYVAGTDLRSLLRKHGPLSPADSLFLIGQAAMALDAAHRRGLVHRDVKPGNLLIERGEDDDPDHVYLADFGITKHTMSRSGLTATGEFMGTIDYVAPEQIRGGGVDARADQYSLGCVLYESLTGQVPFAKDLDAAVIWAHVEEAPPAPSSVRQDLPPSLDAVVTRAMAKDPADRYPTCRAMVDAARVALGGIAAGPRTVIADLGGAGASTGPGSGYGTDPGSHPGQGPNPSYGPGSGYNQPSGYGTGPRADSGVTQLRQVPGTGAPAASGPVSGPGAAAGQASGPGPAPVATPVPAQASSGGTGPGTGYGPGQPPPPGGQPGPGGPHRSARMKVLAIAAALVVVLGGSIGAWAVMHGNGSSGGHPSSMGSSMSPMASPHQGKLQKALTAANHSQAATGQLPPSSCKAMNATMITCTNPTSVITSANFRTYPTLKALYAAYQARTAAISATGKFRQNFQDCTKLEPEGEVSWNHNTLHDPHSKKYSLAQVSSGMLQDAQAAGRVACNFVSGQEEFIWTQNDGKMLAWAFGAPHPSVWRWWVDVHHNIPLTGEKHMSM
jgi:serine/threonine-protein kinase